MVCKVGGNYGTFAEEYIYVTLESMFGVKIAIKCEFDNNRALTFKESLERQAQAKITNVDFFFQNAKEMNEAMANRKFMQRNVSQAGELNKQAKAIQCKHFAVRSELKALEASTKVQSLDNSNREMKMRKLNKWDDFRKRREELIIRYVGLKTADLRAR